MTDFILSARRTPIVREVVVEYKIPVYVLVRQEQGFKPFIAKVVVDDEATFEHGEAFGPNGKDQPANKRLAKEAQSLIEDGDINWPGWQFGW